MAFRAAQLDLRLRLRFRRHSLINQNLDGKAEPFRTECGKPRKSLRFIGYPLFVHRLSLKGDLRSPPLHSSN